MLAIPVMRAEGVLDLTNLEKTLRSQNCFSDEMIINDVKKFDQMRRDVVAIHDPNDSTQQMLLQYYYQVKSLVARFQPIENDIKFNFTWNDAFVHGRKATMSSLNFELASILWNLAAFESIRATKVDRSSDEGIRLAGKHFQQAAGYFDHLKDVVLPFLSQQGGPSTTLQCLTTDCLNMVKLLMLSQGQLCFYEKAVRDKKREAMKTGIVAKLAAQTSTFYQQTAVATRQGPLGTILDISWFALADFQSKCFHGAAEYWQALASKELALQKGSGYGEEIARYNRAEGYIRQAVESGRKHNILPALISGADSLQSVINTNRQNAQKDLTTVYMENVPNEGSLPEVIGVVMVKPTLIPEQNTVLPSVEVLLFKFVLPKSIMDGNNRFYAEINSLYASVSTTGENATNIGRTTLSSVGLPGALESMKTENNIPVNLWNKILKIQSMGSIDRLKSLVLELNNLSKRANSSIEILETAIRAEEEKDNYFFQQFPTYNGTRSSVLNKDIKNNLKLLKEAYQNALMNDGTIQKDLRDNCVEGKLLLLTKSKEELLKMLTAVSSAAAAKKKEVNLLDFDEYEPSPAVSGKAGGDLLGPDGHKLEGRLHELAELFEIRLAILQKLKQFVSISIQDEVTNVFLGNGSVQEVYDRYMNDINSLKAQLDQGFRRQDELLSEIVRLNDLFNKYKENNPILLEKNRFLMNLEEMTNKYFALHSQVTAGQTFYTNLQSKLTTLQQNIDDMAYTQQWQRQEYERDQFDEHNRLEMERKDRELAMKLSNELSITEQMQIQQQNQQQQQQPGYNQPAGFGGYSGSYAPQQQQQQQQQQQPPMQYNNSYNPQQQQQLQPQQPQQAVSALPVGVTNSNNIYYGQPVSGPPAGFVDHHNQQQQQQLPPPLPPKPMTQTASAYSVNPPAMQSNYNYQQNMNNNNNPPPAQYPNNNNNNNISYAATSSSSLYGNNAPAFPQPTPNYGYQPQQQQPPQQQMMMNPGYQQQQQPPLPQPQQQQPQKPLTKEEMEAKVNNNKCFFE
jgi:programmed cell death 6-interacting protein